jgi:hypothetical protein
MPPKVKIARNDIINAAVEIAKMCDEVYDLCKI